MQMRKETPKLLHKWQIIDDAFIAKKEINGDTSKELILQPIENMCPKQKYQICTHFVVETRKTTQTPPK